MLSTRSKFIEFPASQRQVAVDTMFGILGPVDVGTSETFKSFEELFHALKARMAHEGYKIVKSRTHRYKTGGQYAKGGEIVRCDLVCDRGGQPYKCQATRLKTSTKKTDCPWKAKAVNRKTLGAWVLTVLCDEHNHEPRTPEPPSDGEQDADAEADAENEVAAVVPAAPETGGKHGRHKTSP
jgi:FAR1 DNA-binding domain